MGKEGYGGDGRGSGVNQNNLQCLFVGSRVNVNILARNYISNRWQGDISCSFNLIFKHRSEGVHRREVVGTHNSYQGRRGPKCGRIDDVVV